MMDVIFQTSEGKTFTMEIWFFDTVLEIKEKIQKYEGYPVSQQTLLINGKVMENDHNTEYYDVVEGSDLKLFLGPTDSAGKPVVNVEQLVNAKVSILVKHPPSRRQFNLEMDVNDTTAQLKERIRDIEGMSVGRFVLFVGNIELQDHRALADYGVSDGSEVHIVLRALTPAMAAGASKKLKLMVLPNCGAKKIPVEVNSADNVCELRKELQRLHNHLHFHLPTDGYFFIYRQNVMDEDRSFRWHEVHQGDTIEMFKGSITGGS